MSAGSPSRAVPRSAGPACPAQAARCGAVTRWAAAAAAAPVGLGGCLIPPASEGPGGRSGRGSVVLVSGGAAAGGSAALSLLCPRPPFPGGAGASGLLLHRVFIWTERC